MIIVYWRSALALPGNSVGKERELYVLSWGCFWAKLHFLSHENEMDIAEWPGGSLDL